MKHYSPTGRRNHGRPLKRLLDPWDRNGSTSGPTPWQICVYDDDIIIASIYRRHFIFCAVQHTLVATSFHPRHNSLYLHQILGLCTSTPPTKLKATQTPPNLKPNLNNTGKTRRRSYPPNFNKTPAKIIQAETGASTWALVSHKLTINIDILPQKGKNHTNIKWTTNKGTINYNTNRPQKQQWRLFNHTLADHF